MIHESVIEDTKRLYEIISEVKSRLQMALASSANFAADRATSYHSQSAYYNELLKGIEYFKFVCGLSSDFEGKKQEIVNNLIKVSEYIFAKGNLLISITAEDENCNQVMNAIVPFIDMLSDKGNNNFIEAKKCGSAAAWKNCDYKFKLEQKNEGFYYPGQVQYVARTGNYIKDGFKTTGALKVLRSILSREYLWNNVRVKGGAYGCLCGVGSIDGSAYFSSYRDPNLRETNQVYENMADYVTSFDADERDMTKYIIGTMSTVDAPLTPKMDGSRSLNAFLSSITMEDIQKDRDELLSTTKDTIRSLSGIINSIMAQNNLCVIGNETKLKDNKDMFNELKSLF